jgi:hypothetical protein
VQHLGEPWYPEEEDVPQPLIRQLAQLTTPVALRKRNIWCSDRLFRTKYDQAGKLPASLLT